MQLKNWRAPLGKAVAAVALSMCAVFSTAPVAMAEDVAPLDARVQDALNELTRLNIMAEQSQYDVISSTAHLNATEQLMGELDTKISQLSEDLKSAKADLAKFVSDDYKNGTVSLLDIIFESKSFDDMVSRIVYANKVAEHKNQAIARVDSLFTSLATRRDQLSQAAERQKHFMNEQAERQAVASQASASAEAYYTQLSDDVKQGLSQVSNEQRQAAVEATLQTLNEMAVTQAATQPTAEQEASVVESAEAVAFVQELLADPELGGIADEAGVSNAELSDAIAQVASTGETGGSYGDLVSRAYSLLGSGYQWSGYSWTGETDTSAFTCSGVIDYALGRDSQSSSPETLYEEVGSNITTDVSQLQEGDLVFYSYGGREVGHVGLYIGDGQVIDSIPNGGVAVRDVDYMDVVGGGSLG